MIIDPLSLNWFVNQLKDNNPFTFARYGDGEWLTLLGFYGMRNSNGCTFSKPLSDDMRAVLYRQNDYQHAILKIARRERPVPFQGKPTPYGGQVIEQWLQDHQIDMPWYDGDVLLEESLAGHLFPLIEQIREKRVLYVGNHRLRNLNMRGVGFFPYVSYIEPPARDTHQVMDRLLRDIYRAIRRNKVDFIGWSSGLAAKVMIDKVFMRFPEVTQIDFGSQFDGYFSPMSHVSPLGSRSYIRKGKYDWEELLRMNTGMEEIKEVA